MSKTDDYVGKYKVSVENARTEIRNLVRSCAMAYAVSRPPHRGGHSSNPSQSMWDL
jgi:hypothetical protein